jgi:Carboxypeptidase regulatory-like domain
MMKCKGPVNRVSSQRIAFYSAFVLLIGVALSAATAVAQGGRVVQGKVLTASDAPVPGAIVYLKDMKTLGVKSAISLTDGSYRFGQLADTTDYEIWAELQGKKSSSRGISSFDTKKLLTLNLKLGK